MSLAPRGEGFGHQRAHTRGIRERAAEIAAQLPFEFRELLFIAPNFLPDLVVFFVGQVLRQHQAIAFLQFRGPCVFLVHQEREHFFVVRVPRMMALQPGDALVIRIGCVVGHPAIAVRHEHHHNLRLVDLFQTRGKRWQVAAGGEILHISRRKADGQRGLRRDFAMFFQILGCGGDKDDRIVAHIAFILSERQ